MAGSNRRTSRYQREQRFTVTSWAVLVIVGVMLGWAHHSWSAARSASLGGDETSPPSAPTPSLHVWLDQSEPSINGLVAARNTIATAAAHRDIAATGAACQNATGALTNLREQMPSPEPVVNSTLQQAISSYAAGLPYCVAATRTEDGEGLQRAATYISQGDAAMQLVLDILGNESDAQPHNLGVLIV